MAQLVLAATLIENLCPINLFAAHEFNIEMRIPT